MPCYAQVPPVPTFGMSDGGRGSARFTDPKAPPPDPDMSCSAAVAAETKMRAFALSQALREPVMRKNRGVPSLAIARSMLARGGPAACARPHTAAAAAPFVADGWMMRSAVERPAAVGEVPGIGAPRTDALRSPRAVQTPDPGHYRGATSHKRWWSAGEAEVDATARLLTYGGATMPAGSAATPARKAALEAALEAGAFTGGAYSTPAQRPPRQ
jgi:hypothetical protein